MKILIVDDESTALEKMAMLFSAYGECDTAADGEMALQMFSAAVHNDNPYDLISIDVELPGVTGIQILETIYSDEQKRKTSPCKKIMITASGTRENIIAAAKYKCDCFLVKPVKRNVFDEKMAEIGLNKLK